MARVVVVPRALDDVEHILDYLRAEAGVPTATKYQEGFRAAFRVLREHPESGPPRPSLGRDVRIAVVSPYKAIYRYSRSDDTVRILRVVDGRRRITRGMLRTGRP